MSESLSIYKAIEHIGPDWNIFVRTNLGLSELDIEECEMNHHRNLKEQRFQMVKLWQRRGGYRNSIAVLEQHVQSWGGISNQIRNSHQQELTSSQPVQNNTHQAGQYVLPTGQRTLQTAQPLTVQQLTRTAQNFSGHIKNKAKTPTGDLLTPNFDCNQNTLQLTLPKDTGIATQPSCSLYKRREDKLRRSGTEAAGSGSGTLKTFNSSSTISGTNTPPEISDNNSEVSSLRSSRSGSVQESGDVVDGKKKKTGVKKLARKFKNLFSDRPNDSITYHQTEPNMGPAIPQTPGGFSETYCDGVDGINMTTYPQKYYDGLMKSKSNYKIEKPKGLCLLFNNSFPNVKGRTRHGSKKDVKNMKKLWQGFGCDIFKGGVLSDKSASDMKRLLKEATNPPKQYSFMVVIVMTHGGVEGGNLVFEGADGKMVKVKDMLEMYNNEKAPALRDIPKFFILQFCRGIKLDYGVQIDTITTGTLNQETCSADRVEIDAYGSRLPTTSDQLVAYATQEDYVALRNPQNGSWFINALTNIFMRCAAYEDVQHMLTRVHLAMKEKQGSYTKTDGKLIRSVPIKAMSEHKSSFTKRLYLVPGYP